MRAVHMLQHSVRQFFKEDFFRIEVEESAFQDFINRVRSSSNRAMRKASRSSTPP